MSAKHTPGPWWASGSDFAVLAADADDAPYARTVAETNVGDMTDVEALANARLIAAAPDLLHALKQMQACSHKTHSHGEFPAKTCGLCTKALAAIAKAEGQS